MQGMGKVEDPVCTAGLGVTSCGDVLTRVVDFGGKAAWPG